MKLTDNLCRSTKPTARYQDFSDPGTPLTFRVKANGERIFLWRGRVGGKQTMRVIGSYPAMTLADARLEAAKMKKDAKANVASIAPVIHPQHRPKFTTLQEAAERFEKVRLVHNVSGDQVMAMFNARLLSKLGKRDIRSLTRIELNQHFNDHLEAGFNGPAINRYLAHVKALLNWAVREDLIEFNPAATIDKKVKEKPRTRIITDWELAAIVHALPSCGPYAAPLKLLLMTCTRRSDILGLQWGEVVTLDDGTMELNIAPWRTKTEVRHIVPLSKEARAFPRGRSCAGRDIARPATSASRSWRATCSPAAAFITATASKGWRVVRRSRRGRGRTAATSRPMTMYGTTPRTPSRCCAIIWC